jgi:hypothetical protein
MAASTSRAPIWLAKMPPIPFMLEHEPRMVFPMVPAISLAGDVWGHVCGIHPSDKGKVWFIPTSTRTPDVWIIAHENLRIDLDHPNGVHFLLRWLGPQDTIIPQEMGLPMSLSLASSLVIQTLLLLAKSANNTEPAQNLIL